jgi:hypothetical protein
MGVGAVFVSTLAIHRLPSPANPPVTQQDYLSLALQPIVSFIVLSSIIIRKLATCINHLLSVECSLDGLSIPFFNIGRNVSRNVSLSKTLTNPLRSYPDWLLGINRNPTVPQQPGSGSIVEQAPFIGRENIPPKLEQNGQAVTGIIHEAQPQQDSESEVNQDIESASIRPMSMSKDGVHSKEPSSDVIEEARRSPKHVLFSPV